MLGVHVGLMLLLGLHWFWFSPFPFILRILLWPLWKTLFALGASRTEQRTCSLSKCENSRRTNIIHPNDMFTIRGCFLTSFARRCYVLSSSSFTIFLPCSTSFLCCQHTAELSSATEKDLTFHIRLFEWIFVTFPSPIADLLIIKCTRSLMIGAWHWMGWPTSL